ncbi:PREDICTED: beta-1,4-glucuronyltransferase 1-like [Priapulus caudatus]|uniref:Beta-1,4-glucuronyltransferase 1-like n=1 Tax=Priapulus caudatus TaxID=37621 RepID=A0ABM1ELE4_PRICU|nr:PREDICTED: beta-1,4-glucuronyltransferase 1-like [Priapulus caudatus]
MRLNSSQTAPLRVFNVSKWHPAWEPVHIGARDYEPLYDERFYRDDLRDNLHQLYELCRANYDFHVLDDAFLVHSPGIDKGRRLTERTNMRLYYSAVKDIDRRYVDRNSTKEFCTESRKPSKRFRKYLQSSS